MTTQIPQHIAIIMDGNGRWAKQRHLPRVMGHRAGVQAVRNVIKGCIEFGVPVLTLYAFSQENWKRPKDEIKLLMELLDHFLEAELNTLIEQEIRFVTIGRVQELPERIQTKVQKMVKATATGKRLTLVLALNYGARQEITDAVNQLLQARQSQGPVTEAEFSQALYTHGIPDPDLLIRTSGEMRLSNFLLWQLSYSEIYISNKYWPDFRRDDLWCAIETYSERERRFGDIAPKPTLSASAPKT